MGSLRLLNLRASVEKKKKASVETQQEAREEIPTEMEKAQHRQLERMSSGLESTLTLTRTSTKTQKTLTNTRLKESKVRSTVSSWLRHTSNSAKSTHS